MKPFRKALPLLLFGVSFLFSLPALPAGEGYTPKGADSCLKCHKSDKWGVMPIFRSKHGSLTDGDAPFTNLQCESCHGPSAEHAAAGNKSEVTVARTFGKNDRATVADRNEICIGCHANQGRMGWLGSAHEGADVPCVSCHAVHRERDPVFDPLEQQDVCFGCHPRQRSDTHKASGHPLRFGAMACSDCHDVHDGNNDFLLAADNVNDTCYACHAEKRGPYLWEHAPVTESCSLCHESHGSNHPAMLTRRPPLLCQQCHSAAGHPGTAFSGDDLDTNPASRFMQARGCMNCHGQVHGSNHPSGPTQIR